MDLHNLFHFLKLRLDSHAQYEIRVYAEVILDICKKVAPMATESFMNHQNEGVRFSGEEMEALRKSSPANQTLSKAKSSTVSTKR